MPPSVFVIRVTPPSFAFCEHWSSSPFDLPSWVQQSGTWFATSGKGIAAYVPAGAALTNLLTTNQSTFEAGTTTGWEGEPDLEFGGSSPPVYTFLSADNTVSHSGTYSLLLQSGAGTNRYFGTLGGTSGFAVTPNGTYVITAWINCSIPFSAYLYLHVDWYDSSGTLLSRSSNSAQPLPNNTWVQQGWGPVTAPSNAAYARIYGITSGLANTATKIWLDDVVFKATGPAPFGLGSRAFARYPVGVGPIDLSVAWASLSSASRSVVFAYDPTSDTGFTVDYDGGTTVSLTQHNGSTATTLATATVGTFTSATFEIVYDDGPGTIVVKQGGTTIISIDLDTVAGGPYPHMTGVWAGLMTDTANADQWDEFCWTLSPTAGSATGAVRVTYSTADVLIQNTPAARVTWSVADTLISSPPAARVTYSVADVLIT